MRDKILNNTTMIRYDTISKLIPHLLPNVIGWVLATRPFQPAGEECAVEGGSVPIPRGPYSIRKVWVGTDEGNPEKFDPPLQQGMLVMVAHELSEPVLNPEAEHQPRRCELVPELLLHDEVKEGRVVFVHEQIIGVRVLGVV